VGYAGFEGSYPEEEGVKPRLSSVPIEQIGRLAPGLFNVIKINYAEVVEGELKEFGQKRSLLFANVESVGRVVSVTIY
jgi:hypothetical protein